MLTSTIAYVERNVLLQHQRHHILLRLLLSTRVQSQMAPNNWSMK